MRDTPGRSVAVGFFDGLHLGHRAILRGADAALTFRQHPLTVLAPERAPRLLMSAEDRIAAIGACVGEVRALDFTRELADLPAEGFIGILRETAAGAPLKVRCGANWRFGKGGEGDAAFLRERGIAVEVVDYATYGGEPVSSSRIRRCLESGDVEAANAMLGRAFEVTGTAFAGKGRGAGMGFPTINIRLSRPVSLRLGVYAVEMAGRRGVANFGHAPTMGDAAWREPVFEVHLLEGIPDGAAPVAGPVRILRFIRDERTFDSVDGLTRQIAADCAAARIRAESSTPMP